MTVQSVKKESSVENDNVFKSNQSRQINGYDVEIGWKYKDDLDVSFGCIRVKQGDDIIKDVLFNIDDDSDCMFSSSAVDEDGNIYCVGARFNKADKYDSDPVVAMFDKNFKLVNGKAITHPDKKAVNLGIVSYAKDTNEIIGVGMGSANSRGDCMCTVVVDSRTFDVTEFNLYPQPHRNVGDFI